MWENFFHFVADKYAKDFGLEGSDGDITINDIGLKYQCGCGCGCFFGIRSVGIPFFFDLVPYHYRGKDFYGWIPTPPLNSIPITLRLRVPGGLPNNKYLCN